MADDSKQNKSEEATPFKLKRAREKGQVARSMEVGPFAGLVAVTAFVVTVGSATAGELAEMMKYTFSGGIARANDPQAALALIGATYGGALRPVILLGAMVFAVVALLELIQLRGFMISTHPLKPDFSRLNPATGLKRMVSVRMLKEMLKTVVKSVAYGTAAWLVVRYSIAHFSTASTDGERLAAVMRASGLRLLFAFLLVSLAFVLLDQLLVRGEFAKQMRMSRRDLTRENREREGEPRLKQKRKQLHASFVQQAQGVGNLPGSDVMIVNPEHFAVALRYDAGTMAAPVVSAKGRNRHALQLKARAHQLGIAVVVRPPLARALFRECETGDPVPGSRFEELAALYHILLHTPAGDE